MLRLNYRMNFQIKTKIFDNIDEGYQFAIQKIATQDDRKYYKECCGETFEDVVMGIENPADLMICIMKNALKNVVFVCLE